MPAGSNNALGPLYFATFCALSVTLGALLYNLTNVLNEYFALQQQLSKTQEVSRRTATALAFDAPAQLLARPSARQLLPRPHAGDTSCTHAMRCGVLCRADTPVTGQALTVWSGRQQQHDVQVPARACSSGVRGGSTRRTGAQSAAAGSGDRR